MRIAIISSIDDQNMIAVDNMVNTIPMGIALVAFFDDASVAQLWLLKGACQRAAVNAGGRKWAE